MRSTTFCTPRAVPRSACIKRAGARPGAGAERAVVATEAPLNFKTTYDRFSYALRATGHESTLAFELIAKTDKRIAVGHILPQEIVIRQMFEPSGRAG